MVGLQEPVFVCRPFVSEVDWVSQKLMKLLMLVSDGT
jgi:hypothetical protein